MALAVCGFRYTGAMSAQLTTHTTLLARLAKGDDSSAWQEFNDRYGQLIRGFARRRGLQPADCDDVAQEVLLGLSKAMPGVDCMAARAQTDSR